VNKRCRMEAESLLNCVCKDWIRTSPAVTRLCVVVSSKQYPKEDYPKGSFLAAETKEELAEFTAYRWSSSYNACFLLRVFVQRRILLWRGILRRHRKLRKDFWDTHSLNAPKTKASPVQNFPYHHISSPVWFQPNSAQLLRLSQYYKHLSYLSSLA